MNQDDSLDVRRIGGVLVIGLNRPAKRNAIGVEMTLAIERTLLSVSKDERTKAIVFHGIGGNFSAGMDMKDFFDHSSREQEVLRRARSATENWRTRLLRHMPQPIVSAVTGYCLGGALPIIECSDIVLASSDAVFGLPEINFGFVPGGPIAKSVRNAMSVRGASYAALTGRPFSASQACKWGLVTQVLQAGDAFGEAVSLATSLASSSGRADLKEQREQLP